MANNILNDPNLLEKLGNENGLKLIIQKHVHAPCCGGTHSYLKSIDKYLEEVVDFVDEFGPPNPTIGFSNVMQGMKTNEWVSESIAHMFDMIKANPTIFNKSKVTNFDNTFASVLNEAGDVTCQGCKFDIIANGKRYELKSYGETNVNGIASGNIKNQHRAYIETGTIDDTRYLFNKLKLEDTYTIDGESVTAEEYVRSNFLKMYQTNTAYFWNNGSTSGWWQSVSGQTFDNGDQLLTWLNSQKYDSEWLDFIKVQ